MKVLVINAGSSSLKYQLIDMENEAVLAKGNCERIGVDGLITHKTSDGRTVSHNTPFPTHKEAIMEVVNILTEGEGKVIDSVKEISAVGHRVLHGGMAFTQGVLSGVEVVVAQCSPGKVNAALCAQAMIDHYSPRLVLNLGVAGGIGENVHIGDVVIATACVEYDFDTSALDQWPAGQLTLPGYEEPMRFLPCGQTLAHILSRAAEGLYGRAHLGIVATGDKFVADPHFGDYLQKEFGALACEMEGGAIAHACLVNKIPCAVLRTISDNAHDSETVDFVTFAKSSAEKAQQLLRAVLPQL